MVDFIDQSDEKNELILKSQIANSAKHYHQKRGPEDCLQCGEFNDRAKQGYGACTECTEALLSNKDTT